jgi:predicted Zn-dependent peptidase
MIINLKNETKLSGLYVVYRGSTNLERPGWYGLSHFMEHLVCKSLDDIQDELQENGIEWNAYTSNNNIVFYLSGLEEYLAPFRSTFVERLSSFNVTPEEVEKEKKIVLEEYKDCFTDQSEKHYTNYMRRAFGSYGPIGLGRDIEGFTYQDCLDFFALQYAKPDVVVNVSRDFEYVDEAQSFTDRSNTTQRVYAPLPDAPIEGSMTPSDKSDIIYSMDINQEDVPYVMILNNMLGNGLNSPLYQEVREKRGLVYYIQCYLDRIGDKWINHIFSMTSNENLSEYEEAVAHVLRDRDTYITQERMSLILKTMRISHEQKMINRHLNINDIINPASNYVYTMLDEVTLETLKEVYERCFNIAEFTRSVDNELYQTAQ